MTYLTKNLAFFSNLDGMQAICAEKVFVKKVVPKHPQGVSELLFSQTFFMHKAPAFRPNY